MSFILYLLFVIFVISSSQPYDDNEFYDEAEQYEELLQPESSFQKPKAPHHPGSNPKNIIPNRNMEIPPEIRQAHPHMNPRMNQRNPNMMNNHQFHNVPPNRQHMPNSRAGEFQEGPLGHQGPMNINGHNRRHNGPNIPPSQTYHSTPQQTYSTNTNTNNSWYSGTFGTIYEIMMILFLVGLVYNCLFGRNQNDKHALAWYNANKQYFEERYEHIGLEKAEMDEIPIESTLKDSVLIKESPYFYKFYYSNYRYIKWSLTALEFRKRFDATSMLTTMFITDRDKLIYEVAFNPVDPLGWVFCVCNKREVPGLKATYGDIDYFTQPYEPSVMNESMCLLS